ncbi:MAG: biopolymer transporter ExbD [Pseudomonadota bacterium]
MQRKAGIFAKKRSKGDDDERILPLVNIVFLLLIFFMVVGRLSASDPFEVVPPRSLSEGQPANEPLLLAIGPEGELALNGELIEQDALMTRISDLAQEPDAAELRIKSDGRVGAAEVVALMEQLRLAGVASVRLMTVPAERDANEAAGQREG